ncbi:indolethylamine N-methyltransferase-like isoform 2-T2 [Anomaloglossus baeobatrachus]|uniref:indolethylamine N-methyltransferase-like n=1 Tax=Anomaloglossus baeobatrachus TaxID=238106 RepID=UPI003F4F7E6C
MNSSNYKSYHEDDFDARNPLENYFSDKVPFVDDSIKFPLENLTKTFSDGHITGNILIELSASSTIHHLFAVCEFFKHIIVLKTRDESIMELKRWVDERTGAFDWDHAAKHHAGLEGKSDQFQDKGRKVRSSLRHVMKCDLRKNNIVDPIPLPPADCIIIAWFLEFMSKNQDEFENYLKKISKLLKPGGHLMFFGILGATYITNRKDKFHLFNYDENVAKKALIAEGFVIDDCKIHKRTAVSDLSDYNGVLFIAAHKQK